MDTSLCLRLLLLLTISEVLIVIKCSQDVQVEVTNCGVGFEFIQHRFDTLQYKYYEDVFFSNSESFKILN